LLVPVTAFDRSGNRLGKGKGVYDRLVAAMRAHGCDPMLVGIAFSVQEVAAIPVEPHDVRLSWIVTETFTLRFPASGSPAG
jgi:5-formyltetrahydrofolate cyclo-ligase